MATNLITVGLIVFILISVGHLYYLKRKYYKVQQKRYYKRSLLTLFVVMFFPYFMTFYLLPEHLNNPINSVLSVAIALFGWLLHPKIYVK